MLFRSLGGLGLVLPGLDPQEPGKDEPKSTKHFADADKVYERAAGECRRHALGHLVHRHDELRPACEQEQQREQDLNRPQSLFNKQFSNIPNGATRMKAMALRKVTSV